MATVFSVIAATIYGNRGAEAMLETVVGRLREQRPDARFHVFTYYPEDDARLLKADGVTLHSSTPAALVLWLLPWSLLFGVLRRVFGRGVLRFAPRAVRALGESIALVDLAGVAFIDGREKFLPFNVLTLLPAWLVGTPVVKMSQAVGPFRKPVNRLAAAFMLRRCARVWARGERTWQHLDQAGFKGVDFARADDIAFNHKQGYSLSDEAGPELQQRFDALSTARGQGVRGVIGICPSSVVAVQSRKNGGNYEQVLAGLVDDLAAQGFLVVLFPNATRALAGEAERNNDLPVIRRILQALSTGRGGAAPVAFDLDVNATDIKRIIAEMDVVLVSRFHAMVGALSLSVPVAVLGWSHKYAEVMARFGQEQWVMDYKELSREELRRQVEAVFAQRADVRAQVLERLPEVKASAARPVDSLLTPSLGAGVA